MTAGASLLVQIAGWTATGCTDFCPASNPSLNQIIVSVIVDVAGGLLAALLSMISFALLRNRFQVEAAPVDS